MTTFEGNLQGDGLRVAIVCGRFNDVVVTRLRDGAVDGLVRRGVDRDAITEAWCPGAFEIPVVVKRLAESGEYDAVIALGCVIRGDTSHYDFVAGQCAAGLQRVQLDTGVPVIFGVLTTDTMEQAIDRAGGKAGNKGASSAETAVEMANLLAQFGKSAFPD